MLSVYEAVMITSILHCQSKLKVTPFLHLCNPPNPHVNFPGHHTHLVSVRHGFGPTSASHQHFLQLSHLLVRRKLPRDFPGDFLRLAEEGRAHSEPR